MEHQREYFNFVEFRKKFVTPFFRQVRYRTDVATSTRFVPCCHWHALDEFESENDYGIPLAPIMAYTKQDIERYEDTGDLFIMTYGCTEYRRDWILSIAEWHRLSMQFVSQISPECEMWVVAKKYEIRRRMREYFFAICRIRIALNRAVDRLYRPPNGSIYRRLLHESTSIFPYSQSSRTSSSTEAHHH